MKRLIFASALLCSFDLNMVSGMNPNQQLEETEIQNNRAEPFDIAMNGFNLEEDYSEEEILNGNNSSRECIACTDFGFFVFYSGMSLLLANMISFALNPLGEDPSEQSSIMRKTIAYFIGIGALMTTFFTYNAINCENIEIIPKILLSSSVSSIQTFWSFSKNKLMSRRGAVESIALFASEGMTYLLALTGGSFLFYSLYDLRRR